MVPCQQEISMVIIFKFKFKCRATIVRFILTLIALMYCTLITSVIGFALILVGYLLEQDILFWIGFPLCVIVVWIFIATTAYDRPSTWSINAVSRTDIDDIRKSATVENYQNNPNVKYSCKLALLSRGHTFIEQWSLNLESKENINDEKNNDNNGGSDLHILLVHGFSSFTSLADSFPPALIKKLETNDFCINNKRVVSIIHYHLYGRGKSDCPLGCHDGSLYTSQINDVLLNCDNYKSNDELIVFGFSMGGAISTLFAYNNACVNNNLRIYKLIGIAPAGLPLKIPLIAKIGVAPLIGELTFPFMAKSELIKSFGEEYYDIENNKIGKKDYENMLKEFDIWFDKQSKVWYAILSTLRYFPMQQLGKQFDKLYEKIGTKGNWMFILGGKDVTVTPDKFEKFSKCKTVVMKNMAHMDLVAEYGISEWIDEFWDWVNK